MALGVEGSGRGMSHDWLGNNLDALIAAAAQETAEDKKKKKVRVEGDRGGGWNRVEARCWPARFRIDSNVIGDGKSLFFPLCTEVLTRCFSFFLFLF